MTTAVASRAAPARWGARRRSASLRSRASCCYLGRLARVEGGGLDDLVHDAEQLERVGGADHQVVVGVEAAVEVEAAELARLEQQRDDELNVHARRVMAGIHHDLRLVA